MKYMITKASRCSGSGRWICSRWTERLVCVQDDAKGHDLRYRGVTVLYESPILAKWWSHGHYALTPRTRSWYVWLRSVGGWPGVASLCGVHDANLEVL